MEDGQKKSKLVTEGGAEMSLRVTVVTSGRRGTVAASVRIAAASSRTT